MHRSVRVTTLTGLGAVALLFAACSDSITPNVTGVAESAALLSPSGTPGLVGQYAFNEGSGIIAHDGSGAGADATLFGAGWSTDSPIGGAGNFSLDLTGNTPHYAVPSTRWAEVPETALSLSPTALTLAAWVKGGSGAAVVIGKQLTGNARDSFALFRWFGSWIFSVDGVGGNVGVAFASPDPAAWTHVAGTYDGSMLRLYVDGVLVGSTPASVVMSFTGEPVTIGADYDIFGTKAGGGVPDAGWPGLIDDAEIHNRALSAAEVAYLARRTPLPPPTNPATKDDCKKDGWKAFGFENQGQCVRFVETGKDSRP